MAQRRVHLTAKTQILEKIMDSYQTRFFKGKDVFDGSALEVTVEHETRMNPKASGKSTVFIARGNWLADGKRKPAFRRTEDIMDWRGVKVDADDYTARIKHSLDPAFYRADTQERGRVVITPKVSYNDVVHAIEKYVRSMGGKLSQKEFVEVVGGAPFKVIQWEEKRHRKIRSDRLYTIRDIFDFSREMYTDNFKIDKNVGHDIQRGVWQTRMNRRYHVSSIYQRVLDLLDPPEKKEEHVQGNLF
ncbi:hypothetical protein GOV09_04330 [Candidatus Woesearchaeota archaeon]|nr:hypothetical protein [Candidatus Woesearchaeota archaeon]